MAGMRKKDLPADFARRLVEAMLLKGLRSDRNRSGVDVSALASAAGVTYEMARRYVEGLALPRTDAVSRLAEWLGVSSSWLAYGEGPREGVPVVDPGLLERCLRAVTDAQRIAGIELTAERAAQLVARLYREASRGELPTAQALAAALAVFGPAKDVPT